MEEYSKIKKQTEQWIEDEKKNPDKEEAISNVIQKFNDEYNDKDNIFQNSLFFKDICREEFGDIGEQIIEHPSSYKLRDTIDGFTNVYKSNTKFFLEDKQQITKLFNEIHDNFPRNDDIYGNEKEVFASVMKEKIDFNRNCRNEDRIYTFHNKEDKEAYIFLVENKEQTIKELEYMKLEELGRSFPVVCQLKDEAYKYTDKIEREIRENMDCTRTDYRSIELKNEQDCIRYMEEIESIKEAIDKNMIQEVQEKLEESYEKYIKENEIENPKEEKEQLKCMLKDIEEQKGIYDDAREILGTREGKNNLYELLLSDQHKNQEQDIDRRNYLQEVML